MVFLRFVPPRLTPAVFRRSIAPVSSLSRLLRSHPDDASAIAALSPPEEKLEAGEALRLIEQAEELGVPWREILSREIFAEGMLQRFLGSELGDFSLWRAVSILPDTLFHSWRVRALLDRLCWEASAQGSRAARRELDSLLNCLAGVRSRRVTREATLAKHYWFAYHRVLELQGVALAAEKCRAPADQRVAEVCESTAASRRDAEWAVARLAAQTRSHALDDAMARAREEGFEIPRAETELRAFSRLRRFVSRYRLFREPPSGRQRRANPAVPRSRVGKSKRDPVGKMPPSG